MFRKTRQVLFWRAAASRFEPLEMYQSSLLHSFNCSDRSRISCNIIPVICFNEREPDQGGQYKSWELRRLNSMIYDKQRLQEPVVHPDYCSTYYICITTFSNQKSTELGVFFFFFFLVCTLRQLIHDTDNIKSSYWTFEMVSLIWSRFRHAKVNLSSYWVWIGMHKKRYVSRLLLSGVPRSRPTCSRR